MCFFCSLVFSFIACYDYWIPNFIIYQHPLHINLCHIYIFCTCNIIRQYISINISPEKSNISQTESPDSDLPPSLWSGLKQTIQFTNPWNLTRILGRHPRQAAAARGRQITFFYSCHRRPFLFPVRKSDRESAGAAIESIHTEIQTHKGITSRGQICQ